MESMADDLFMGEEHRLLRAQIRRYVQAELAPHVDRFEREFIGQREGGRRLPETFAAGWRLLESLPREDLTRLSDAVWEARPSAEPPSSPAAEPAR